MQILPPRGNLSKEKTVPWWIILISVIAGLVLVAGVIFVFHKVSTNSLTILLYTHTNQFCVVQANIKPEALKVQTEHTRLNLITYLQILTCIIYSNHFFFCHVVSVYRKSHRPKAIAVAAKMQSCIVLFKATGNPQEMCD